MLNKINLYEILGVVGSTSRSWDYVVNVCLRHSFVRYLRELSNAPGRDNLFITQLAVIIAKEGKCKLPNARDGIRTRTVEILSFVSAASWTTRARPYGNLLNTPRNCARSFTSMAGICGSLLALSRFF